MRPALGIAGLMAEQELDRVLARHADAKALQVWKNIRRHTDALEIVKLLHGPDREYGVYTGRGPWRWKMSWRMALRRLRVQVMPVTCLHFLLVR